LWFDATGIRNVSDEQAQLPAQSICERAQDGTSKNGANGCCSSDDLLLGVAQEVAKVVADQRQRTTHYTCIVSEEKPGDGCLKTHQHPPVSPLFRALTANIKNNRYLVTLSSSSARTRSSS
jgi:hypothetical protein